MASPKIGGVDLLTLQAVLEYCHNWFFDPLKIYHDEYTITDGQFPETDNLQIGQYYRIVGSVFNEGLHQYGDTENLLIDETFGGAIWALSIPPAVIALAGEIADWKSKYQDAANSPYSSESFFGYSYTKASGVTQDGGKGGWQAVFAGRMARWRKL